MVLQSAVLGLGAYLVIQRPGHRRGHDRRLDPGLARAGSDRDRHRQLARLRRRAPEPGAAVEAAGARSGAQRTSLALPKPRGSLDVESLWVAPPGQQRAILQGVSFSLTAGDGPRHDRTVGVRQVDPGAGPGRRLAAAARHGAARWRGAGPVAARGARAPYRLPAAGHRAVRRHDRREHCALRSRRQQRGDHRSSHARPACTT